MAAWTDQDVADLEAFLASGLSHAAIGRLTKRGTNAIHAAVRRYIYKKPRSGSREFRQRDERRRHVVRRLKEGRLPEERFSSNHLWTEEFLTEPWAVRKLRKSLESIGR